MGMYMGVSNGGNSGSVIECCFRYGLSRHDRGHFRPALHFRFGSFRNMMVGQITDSMLGHLEVHRKGYLASIDNLPLNLNLNPQAFKKLADILGHQPEVEAFSPRIKFGGMFSTFVETTNVRLNGVSPDQEIQNHSPSALKDHSGPKNPEQGRNLGPRSACKGNEGRRRRYDRYCRYK